MIMAAVLFDPLSIQDRPPQNVPVVTLSSYDMRAPELNAKLRTFCTMNPQRCEFIEVIAAVCSHAQSPVDSSLTVDGLHLSPLGYERWRNAIAQYVGAK